MNSNIFKSYDIRGKYPQEINEKIISEIISALARHFNQKPKTKNLKLKIIIGHDTRLSSPSLYRAIINSIKHQLLSIEIIKIGIATTPMLYFLVKYFNVDMGIMITASHNPKKYNGLKIVDKNAAPVSGKEILRIINNKL